MLIFWFYVCVVWGFFGCLKFFPYLTAYCNKNLKQIGLAIETHAFHFQGNCHIDTQQHEQGCVPASEDVLICGSHSVLWIPPSGRAVMATAACAWIRPGQCESHQCFPAAVAEIVACRGATWALSAARSFPLCSLHHSCFTDFLIVLFILSFLVNFMTVRYDFNYSLVSFTLRAIQYISLLRSAVK